MLIAGLLALYLLYKNKKFSILKDPVIVLTAVYAVLHLLLLGYQPQGWTPALAGLAIDLRYALFFALVYIAMRLYPGYRHKFIKVGIAGAFVVLVFSILQVFFLPYDFLKYLGYSKYNIVPYLLIDQNYDYIRINSTLRGPNPLGAYAVMALVMVTSAIIHGKIKQERLNRLSTVVLVFGALVALWYSYSRSALLAAVVCVFAVVAYTVGEKVRRRPWMVWAGVVAVLSIGGVVASNSQLVSNVLLHDNPSNSEAYGSNLGHVSSLKDGFGQMKRQPLGAGIGSTGSASILSGKNEIIENQFLYIAHEVGWLGLGLFLSIYGWVLWKLWQLRADWFALGTFVSGIGIGLICLVLPILVDDTVAIIWWGLAALALFPSKKTEVL